MTTYVVDANVAFAWLLPHRYTDAAGRLFRRNVSLFAPDLLYAEFGNALWKNVTFGLLPPHEADSAMQALLDMPIDITPNRLLSRDAVNIAFSAGRSVYDCTYLALSQQVGVPVVTCDQKFYNALKNTRYAKQVVWVEDLPES